MNFIAIPFITLSLLLPIIILIALIYATIVLRKQKRYFLLIFLYILTIFIIYSAGDKIFYTFIELIHGQNIYP